MGNDVTERKRTEEQIKSQLEELQRWQDVMLGHEVRVMELKNEVNELLTKLGQPPRYESSDVQNEDRFSTQAGMLRQRLC